MSLIRMLPSWISYSMDLAAAATRPRPQYTPTPILAPIDAKPKDNAHQPMVSGPPISYRCNRYAINFIEVFLYFAVLGISKVLRVPHIRNIYGAIYFNSFDTSETFTNVTKNNVVLAILNFIYVWSLHTLHGVWQEVILGPIYDKQQLASLCTHNISQIIIFQIWLTREVPKLPQIIDNRKKGDLSNFFEFLFEFEHSHIQCLSWALSLLYKKSKFFMIFSKNSNVLLNIGILKSDF